MSAVSALPRGAHSDALRGARRRTIVRLPPEVLNIQREDDVIKSDGDYAHGVQIGNAALRLQVA